ncbi:MAG: hypothetical protein R3C11_14700 [Planctomycetaceae bacterium]
MKEVEISFPAGTTFREAIEGLGPKFDQDVEIEAIDNELGDLKSEAEFQFQVNSVPKGVQKIYAHWKSMYADFFDPDYRLVNEMRVLRNETGFLVTSIHSRSNMQVPLELRMYSVTEITFGSEEDANTLIDLIKESIKTEWKGESSDVIEHFYPFDEDMEELEVSTGSIIDVFGLSRAVEVEPDESGIIQLDAENTESESRSKLGKCSTGATIYYLQRTNLLIVNAPKSVQYEIDILLDKIRGAIPKPKEGAQPRGGFGGNLF